MAAQEPDIGLAFPTAGMWVVAGVEEQPPNSCVSGVNVRILDPLEGRDRGGSWTGMVRAAMSRVNGGHPIQSLGFVVTTDPNATLFAFDQSSSGPGTRISDPSSSNFPDGPGPTGPGGNPQGGPFGPPGFNRRQPVVPRTIRQGGSGVMPTRHTPTASPPVVPSPPSPPPPATLTRTYTPFDSVYNTENVGKFSVGPFTTPLTPPTDLAPVAVDFFGAQWNIDLSAWGGTQLPTVAEINAKFLSAGWSDTGTPAGPYRTSTDS